jgi:hypothetical protein
MKAANSIVALKEKKGDKDSKVNKALLWFLMDQRRRLPSETERRCM